MLTMLRTDAGLVRQVLAGHSRSFDELVRRHLTMTYGIAFSYTRNHADAEDLSQEAMLKAFMSLDTLREPKKFGHWLSVITRNLALRYGRKLRNEREAAKESAEQPRDLNTAAYDDMRELLEEQISELEPIPREVLMLHYFSGKTTREIASSMNVSQAAVLKRLQRAREVLGAKLISDLNVLPRSKDEADMNRSVIMKSIIATGISWNIAGATWAETAASTLFSGKGMAAAVLFAGIIASYLALPSAKPLPTPEPTISTAGDVVAPSPEEETPITIATPSIEIEAALVVENLEPIAAVSVAVLTPEPELQVEAKPESPLAGNWTMYTHEGNDQFADNRGQIRFVEENDTLHVAGVSYMHLEGAFAGEEVYLDFSHVTEPELTYRGRLQGRLSEDGNELNVSGFVTWDYNDDTTSVFYIDFVKIGDMENQRNEGIALAKSRLNTLKDALHEFLKQEGRPAKNLRELIPDYLDDRSLINSNADERIVYAQVWDDYKKLQEESSKIGQYYGPLHREDPSAELLLNWELELEEAWGTYFPGGFTFLHLTNTEFNFSLAVDFWGSAYDENPSYPSSYVDTYGEQGQTEARLQACANNLKQLGLTIKMFEGEHPNRLVPPGFRQVYPEYMPDVRILICPGQSDEILSYEIIYPASSEEYRRQVYIEVEGILLEDVDPGAVDSRIPLIVELHECSESGGRNVEFVDGHVEWIADADWERIIGPYLDYRY